MKTTRLGKKATGADLPEILEKLKKSGRAATPVGAPAEIRSVEGTVSISYIAETTQAGLVAGASFFSCSSREGDVFAG
jgi:hypothetical protein